MPDDHGHCLTDWKPAFVGGFLGTLSTFMCDASIFVDLFSSTWLQLCIREELLTSEEVVVGVQ